MFYTHNWCVAIGNNPLVLLIVMIYVFGLIEQEWQKKNYAVSFSKIVET